jgi:hypothetical protein
MGFEKSVKVFQELLEGVAEERCRLPCVFEVQKVHAFLRISSQFRVI